MKQPATVTEASNVEKLESESAPRATICYAACRAMVEWFDSENKPPDGYDHYASVDLCEKAEDLARKAVDCGLPVPSVIVSVAMLELMQDFLFELRGEWKWKEGEKRDRQQEDWQSVNDLIGAVKAIMEAA